jgi:membrane protease YdiL (CAAX protease family)
MPKKSEHGQYVAPGQMSKDYDCESLGKAGNSVKTKQYWIKLLPAIIWYILFLIFSNLFDKYTIVYWNLVFYLGIAVYFFVWHEWRFSEWIGALKAGKAFWFPVLLTALGMVVMFGIGIGITMLFPNTDDGLSVYGISNWGNLVAFAAVTIILPPLAEEAFFRKAITAFDSKTVLSISVILSILLYAGEHSLLPLGFLQACLWAIPLNVAYAKTKNIYVNMTAHFLCNFVMNGITVVVSAVSLFQLT